MEQLYSYILRKWLWLMIIAAALTGVMAYIVEKQQPRIYTASTRLIVGPGVDGLSPDLSDLRAGGQLMQTYSELATTRPVLETVIAEVDLPYDPDTLERSISVGVDEETQILKIEAQNVDPVQAANIANVVADVLLRLSPSGGESPAAILNAQMRNQAAEIEEAILGIEERIGDFEAELEAASTAEEQREYMDQINQERARLSDERATLALLYDSLRITPTNQVKIIEQAIIGEPVAQRLSLVVLVAVVAGLILSLVFVMAFEYFNDVITTAEELGKATGVPVLGTISKHETGQNEFSSEQVVVKAEPESSTTEEYRMLGTKLPLANNGDELRSIVISTVDRSEDAGEVASNLAVVLCQAGRRVILLDANLHHPTVDRLFDLTERSGLTQVLNREIRTPDPAVVDWVPGLLIIPSGPPSHDALAQLASPRMVDLLIKQEEKTDLVIVVTSSALSFADSLFLASQAGGVILVAHSNETRRKATQEAISNLNSVDAYIMGTILVSDRSRLLARLHAIISRSRVRLFDMRGARPYTDKPASVTQLSATQPAEPHSQDYEGKLSGQANEIEPEKRVVPS